MTCATSAGPGRKRRQKIASHFGSREFSRERALILLEASIVAVPVASEMLQDPQAVLAMILLERTAT